jgi:hypothetical protein
VAVLERDEHGNVVQQSVAVDDTTQYCICRRTYPQDSSVMVGCEACGEWFHVACMRLTVCPTHTPGYDPHLDGDVLLTCLVTPRGEHLEVRETYTCPRCSGSEFGVGGAAAAAGVGW